MNAPDVFEWDEFYDPMGFFLLMDYMRRGIDRIVLELVNPASPLGADISPARFGEALEESMPELRQ